MFVSYKKIEPSLKWPRLIAKTGKYAIISKNKFGLSFGGFRHHQIKCVFTYCIITNIFLRTECDFCRSFKPKGTIFCYNYSQRKFSGLTQKMIFFSPILQKRKCINNDKVDFFAELMCGTYHDRVQLDDYY